MDFVLINKDDYNIFNYPTILTKYYNINYYYYLIRLYNTINCELFYDLYKKKYHTKLFQNLVYLSNEIYDISSIIIQLLGASHQSNIYF